MIIILYVLRHSFHDIAVAIVHLREGGVEVSGEVHSVAAFIPRGTPPSIPLESGWAPEVVWMS